MSVAELPLEVALHKVVILRLVTLGIEEHTQSAASTENFH